jgi:hypothetical protein
MPTVGILAPIVRAIGNPKGGPMWHEDMMCPNDWLRLAGRGNGLSRATQLVILWIGKPAQEFRPRRPLACDGATRARCFFLRMLHAASLCCYRACRFDPQRLPLALPLVI